MVAVGKNHTLVLTVSGRVFGFGQNSYGQLGQGRVVSTNTIPLEIKSFSSKKIDFIACGAYSSVVQCEEG
eukprot:jgi/Bigna1/34309/e_gw1.5.252.1